MKSLLSLLLATLISTLPSYGEELPGQKKLAQLNTPEACLRAMNDSDAVLRRAAFNRLLTFPGQHGKAVSDALKHPDAVIRARALLEYFEAEKDAALPELKRMACDPDPQIQKLLIECARRLSSSREANALIAAIGKAASDLTVRQTANRLTSSFRFHRVKQRLSEKPDFDYSIQTIRTIPLPGKGWKFLPDPGEDGHIRNFFAETFDDSRWHPISIGVWEHQGFPDYDGIAWYRIRFTMPEQIPCNAVELFFGAVDEEAWIWLNGIYIGQHTEGVIGWKTPFSLDVTSETRWGKENILVVRVRDSAGAGGIYKPVSVKILR